MSNREDFQVVADILNEWNIAEELEGTVLVGLRFSTIYLTDNGAFCDWMVSFTSTKKLQLEEAEKTRQESLADVFSGYDIEYSPEDYFIEVSDQEFIENAYDEYDVADNASDLVDTVFESLTDLAVSTAIDPEHEEIAKEKLEQKKTEIKAALDTSWH